MCRVPEIKNKKEKKEKKYQSVFKKGKKVRTKKEGGGRGEGGREDRRERRGVCMRLIDNHRQVVSSEKGAVDTSARYHQRRVQKADPSSRADNPNSKLAGRFPANGARAITMEIKNNPNNLSGEVTCQSGDTKTGRDERYRRCRRRRRRSCLSLWFLTRERTEVLARAISQRILL